MDVFRKNEKEKNAADLAPAVREIILEAVLTRLNRLLICQVYTVAMWFGFSGKMKDMFCYIAGNARHINLGFLGFPRGSPPRIVCSKAMARPCATSNSQVSAIRVGLLCVVTSTRRSNNWAQRRRVMYRRQLSNPRRFGPGVARQTRDAAEKQRGANSMWIMLWSGVHIWKRSRL